MRTFLKALLAILSGVVTLFVTAYFLMMISATAGFAAVVLLSFGFGMAFKTSGKYGLLIYSLAIAVPTIIGLGMFTYSTGSEMAYIYPPVVLIAAMLGNYIIYHADSFLGRRALQLTGGYILICILMITTVVPNIHVLDISERVNEPLPEAELTSITRDTVSVSEIESDIVVLDFWATWCGKCIQLMPELERLDEKYRDNPNVTVKAVNTSQGDSFDDMKDFVSEKDLGIDVYYDNDARFSEKIDVSGVPYTVVIDTREEAIKVRKHGFAPGEDYVRVMSDHIDQLLESSNQS